MEKELETLREKYESERHRRKRLQRENEHLRHTCATLQVLARQEAHVLTSSFDNQIHRLEVKRDETEDPEMAERIQKKIDQLRVERGEMEAKILEEARAVEAKMQTAREHTHAAEQQLKERSETSSPHLRDSIHQLSDEVIRLKSLLIASGRAKTEADIDLLEELNDAQNENSRLRRQLQELSSRLSELEKSQAQHEAELEIDEERNFNLQRLALRPDSPGYSSLPFHPTTMSPFPSSSLSSSLSSSPATSGLWHVPPGARPAVRGSPAARRRSASLASDASSTTSSSKN